MFGSVAKFLSDKFSKMPKSVQVITYLTLLILNVYLLLIPRFVNGRLVVKDPTTGGIIPYRGAEIQMHIEGRIYKFTSNEDGYWSIPIVSRLPSSIELDVKHEDKQQWFKLKFDALNVWEKGLQEVEVMDAQPFFKIASLRKKEALISPFALSRWLQIPSPAMAGELRLPDKLSASSLTPAEEDSITRAVITAVSKVTGRKTNEITPNFQLVGEGAPSYIQKIQIVKILEKDFGFIIPDEHWKSMTDVGQLMDYMKKRRILQKSRPMEHWEKVSPSWPAIQQSLPPDERPVFRP